MNDNFDNKTTGSSLDILREYGIDVAPLEVGYKSKDTIIKYGKQLRNMRKEASLTQAELAEAADMAQADISRLERGLGKFGPSLDVMERLADACTHELSVLLKPQSKQHQASSVRETTNKQKIHTDNSSTLEAYKAIRDYMDECRKTTDTSMNSETEQRRTAELTKSINKLGELRDHMDLEPNAVTEARSVAREHNALRENIVREIHKLLGDLRDIRAMKAQRMNDRYRSSTSLKRA